MALTDNMGAADIAAVLGNNDGFGGNNAWWIIILLLCGWGNGGFGNGGFNGGGYPAVQQGFDQAAIMSAIQNGTSATTNGTADVLSGVNSLAMAMQNCCCENRLATANLGSQVASDGCATRQVVSDGFRDAQYSAFVNSQNQIASMEAGFKGINDKLCQLELDAKNETIAQLRSELAAERSAASQNAQTAAIIANNELQTTAIEQYLNPTAIPAYIVQNPNCCAQNYGCGCGSF